jgi:hypothetical protein
MSGSENFLVCYGPGYTGNRYCQGNQPKQLNEHISNGIRDRHYAFTKNGKEAASFSSEAASLMGPRLSIFGGNN